MTTQKKRETFLKKITFDRRSPVFSESWKCSCAQLYSNTKKFEIQCLYIFPLQLPDKKRVTLLSDSSRLKINFLTIMTFQYRLAKVSEDILLLSERVVVQAVHRKSVGCNRHCIIHHHGYTSKFYCSGDVEICPGTLHRAALQKCNNRAAL